MVARIGSEQAPIEFNNARANAVEEGSIVGDEKHGQAQVDQECLEPLNGIKVQVIGGLIEQQQIWPSHQPTGQGHPLLLTPRQHVHHRVGFKAHAFQSLCHPLLPSPSLMGLELVL